MPAPVQRPGVAPAVTVVSKVAGSGVPVVDIIAGAAEGSGAPAAGSCPPRAASAAAASTRPRETSATGTAPAERAASTSDFVAAGATENASPAMPATAGAADEVPQ